MVEPHFRSSPAYDQIDQTIYRGLYEKSPNPYLILSPDLKIINGNDAFVSVTRIGREVFAGKYMFDAFPESTDPANTGVRELMESFKRVLATKEADTLKYQRYDVQNADGIWERRIWDGTSWAITDDRNVITAVILAVREYKSSEITQLLDEAHAQIQKSDALVEQSHKLVQEVERLSEEVKRGRLTQLQTLREMLANWPATKH